MMRVTNTMSSTLTSRTLAQQQYALFETQQMATSGLRVQKGSDDPVAAEMVMRLDSRQSARSQYEENLMHAYSRLDAADKVLGEASELLRQASEQALELANGTVTAAERSAAVVEIQNMRAQMLSLANSQHDNVYLFSGYETETAPFDATGAYVGDTSQMQILGDEGVRLEVGMTGDEVFGATGGTDTFAALDALISALQNNDQAAIASAGTSLSAAHDQVTDGRAVIGGQWSRVIQQMEIVEGRQMAASVERARLVEADAVEVLSSMVSAQTAVNRAIQVSTRMLSTLTLVGNL